MLKILDMVIEISPTHNKRRILITRDELQWVLMIGHPDYDDKNMMKSSNKFYYPRLDYLLKDLLMKKYRAEMGSYNELILDNALLTMDKSFTEIKSIGLKIEDNLKGLLIYESS